MKLGKVGSLAKLVAFSCAELRGTVPLAHGDIKICLVGRFNPPDTYVYTRLHLNASSVKFVNNVNDDPSAIGASNDRDKGTARIGVNYLSWQFCLVR